MSALGVHHDGVHHVRIALPLEPRSLGTAGQIGAVPPLQHQALGGGAHWRVDTQGRQIVPGFVWHDGRQSQSRAASARDQRLQPRPALAQRQRSKILSVFRQQVIGQHAGRVRRHQLGVHRLAVQPLLQVSERRRSSIADHQQFAVDRAFKLQPRHDIGKGAGDFVARPRVQATDASLPHRLHPDAVPLPFGGVISRRQLGEVHRLVYGDGQHHRPETPGRIGAGPLGAAFEPGEQVGVGRLDRVPHLLQIGHVDRRQRRPGRLSVGIGRCGRDVRPDHRRRRLCQPG